MGITTAKIGRRSTLVRMVGAAGAAAFIPAWNRSVEAAESFTCVTGAAPTTTEGPYWVDEKLFRSDIRTDPANGVARAGVPLTLTIQLQNQAGGSCAPLAGAYVDIWHCDAKGIYSDEPTYNPGGGTGNVNTSGQKFLRGYQITDANGEVTFTTIYPGWYASRTIHIHIRVRTYNGTTVLSNFVSQIFFDEAVNDAVLTQPGYARTSARDTTNARDMVFNVANNSRMLATVTGGDSTSGYAARIVMGAVFQVSTTASGNRPAIAAGGVANAVSGVAGISAGSWVSIYGSNFNTTNTALSSADLKDNTLPTSLGGVTVRINGKPAFLQFVGPTQINVLAPSDAATGSVSVTVANSAGTSDAATATLFAFLPGLSVLSGYVRAVRYPDGAVINGTGAAETGYTVSDSVGQGDVIALFGTGFGPTASGTPSAGAVFTGAYATTNAVTVTIGGVSTEVLWAGLVGPGLYQINVRVPASLADGDHAVVASVGGASSQPANAAAASAPASSAPMNPGRSDGRMPENVLVNERAIATAGLAKEVEAVNQ